MKCPLFVELCAGTAALSLRLHHPRARPPVSRMGAKTGYADVILRCLGLYPGQGAADGTRYLWCEPSPGVRLLLHAYRDRALALAAADIIRSWKDEEPRALWERLRAEGPAVCPPVDAREVARWAWVVGHMTPIEDHRVLPAGRDSGGALAGQYNPKYQQTGWSQPHSVWLARRMTTAPTLPATIADDARTVDPREVARYALLGWQSYRQGFPESGFRATAGGTWPDRPPEGEAVAARLEALPGQQATIADDARTVPTPARLPAGTVAYIDPEYEGTTGYTHPFPREEWLPVVRRWRDAGALVCVSEAEPIPDLMAEGWHAVRIDGERRGQKRTFSKQQAEWLTMSEPPRWRPSVQASLFGGAR